MEVRNEAYFCPLVLALVEDASGGEAYYYGRQGEVTKTVRPYSHGECGRYQDLCLWCYV